MAAATLGCDAAAPATPAAASASGTAGPAPSATATASSSPEPFSTASLLEHYQYAQRVLRHQRSVFFTLVNSGQPLELEAEQGAALELSRAEFMLSVSGMAPLYPEPARSAALELREANRQVLQIVRAMHHAGSRAEFTARLADYGAVIAREDAALQRLMTALGG